MYSHGVSLSLSVPAVNSAPNTLLTPRPQIHPFTVRMVSLTRDVRDRRNEREREVRGQAITPVWLIEMLDYKTCPSVLSYISPPPLNALHGQECHSLWTSFEAERLSAAAFGDRSTSLGPGGGKSHLPCANSL